MVRLLRPATRAVRKLAKTMCSQRLLTSYRVFICLILGLSVLLLLSASEPTPVIPQHSDPWIKSQNVTSHSTFRAASTMPSVLTLNATHHPTLANDIKPVNMCIGANISNGDLEDVLCIPKPKYDPSIKNPCWWVTSMISFSQWRRDRRRRGRIPPQMLSSRILRCLPYAHILCCSKSGTTDLFQRISQHPEFVKTGYMGKEHLYWSWYKYGFDYKSRPGKPLQNLDGYISGYRPLVERITWSVDSRPYFVTVDASPADMFDLRGWTLLPQNKGLQEPKVLTPHLMKHIYRDPKFLVLMRNPVEMIYTAYLFHKMGNTSLDFHADVLKSIQLFDGCLSTRPSRRHCYLDKDLQEIMKVEINFMCYAEYIKEWLAVFPRKHFLFIQTERYSRNIAIYLLKVFNFLNMTQPGPELLNRMLYGARAYHTSAKDKAGPMLPATRALLLRYVESCNRELADLLQDDAFLWKEEDVIITTM